MEMVPEIKSVAGRTDVVFALLKKQEAQAKGATTEVRCC
jgi:hypothetical protein